MIKVKDKVIFKLRGDEYVYEVSARHLAILEHPPGSNRNRRIFVELDKKYEKDEEKYKLANEIYGILADGGDWPVPNTTNAEKSMECLNKMVIWIHEQCNIENVKYYEKEKV